MKFMSFNTQHCQNFITREIDYSIIADAIGQCAPDVVALQEMRGKGISADYDAQVSILAEKTRMPYFYFAEATKLDGGNPYGNGLLSRYPLVFAESIPIPDPSERKYTGYYETRCILKAKLECGITVLATHFGLNPDEQENAVKTVLEHLESEKCILMGDLNVRPENAVLSPIRARMKDAAECFDSPLLSFPSDHPTRKIDYIFVSDDLHLRGADIPAIVASDHRPHTAIVDLL